MSKKLHSLLTHDDCIMPNGSVLDVASIVKAVNSHATLVSAWDNAPILSKYHGQRGFETERFISDYREWRDKYRAALALAGETP